MPNSVVQSYAKKSGKSVTEVEKIWKSIAKDHEGDFAYINDTVKKILGIKESIKPYKPFFEIESSDIAVHPETPLKKKAIDNAIGKSKVNNYDKLYKAVVDQREGNK